MCQISLSRNYCKDKILTLFGDIKVIVKSRPKFKSESKSKSKSNSQVNSNSQKPTSVPALPPSTTSENASTANPNSQDQANIEKRRTAHGYLGIHLLPEFRKAQVPDASVDDNEQLPEIPNVSLDHEPQITDIPEVHPTDEPETRVVSSETQIVPPVNEPIYAEVPVTTESTRRNSNHQSVVRSSSMEENIKELGDNWQMCSSAACTKSGDERRNALKLMEQTAVVHLEAVSAMLKELE
ncbi:unnamed protein product [Ambrosiozyma monospora]|uniref:Unnamed protein product n=1 Tax=Ambrosiozyma monospora TaxID=43982 RepID=A0ACB5U608_AMBMO|nr:unnamed protein product [Ambrosiozyma monospora]